MKQVKLVYTVERWMSAVQEPDSQASTQVSSAIKVTDPLNDEDNASVVSSVCSIRSGRSSRSSSRRTSVSTSTSECISAEARRAALLAEANALQRKHAIEKENEELRKMNEVWEVHTETAATTAKIEYLKNAENSVTNGKGVTKDPMNVCCEEMLNKTPSTATNTHEVRPK